MKISGFVSAWFVIILICFISSCGGDDPPTAPQPTPEDLCNNLRKDSLEIGIDCGGPCIPCEVRSEKELIIIDSKVVDSQEAIDGGLSFTHLIETLAGNDSAGSLVKSLFDNWTRDFQVPGTNSIAPSRVGVNDFLSKWQAVDGDTGPLEDWIPNIDNAPFRLLGITNRLDLKDTLDGSAGEGRFTYCAFDPTTPDSSKIIFNVIFEYNLVGNSMEDCSRWVNAWHGLSDSTLTDDQYLDSLIAVTETFVKDNELNQLRTNDFAFEQVWELREFKHDKAANKFTPHFLSKTPDIAFHQMPRLGEEVNNLTNELVNNQKYEFPPDMLAASAVPRTAPPGTSNNPGFKWDIPNVTQDLLKRASTNTCNGCHMGHGGNSNIQFLHMAPRDLREQVEISGRLNGPDRDARIMNMDRLLLGITPVEVFAKRNDTTGMDALQFSSFIDSHIPGH